MEVFSKKVTLLAKWTIFRALLRKEALFGTFCQKADPNADHGSLLEKVKTLGQIDVFFVLSREMRYFLKLSAEKLTQTPTHGSLLEKIASFNQVGDFSCFLSKKGSFCNLLRKS